MLCFWCNEAEAEPSDEDTLYVPCGGCTRKMEAGVTIMEITQEPESIDHVGLSSGSQTVYPTGLWAVVQPAWLTSRLRGNPSLEPVLAGHGYCFVDDTVWDLLGLDRPEVAEGA